VQIISPRGVQSGEEFFEFGCAQQRQCGELALRVGDGSFQQGVEVAEHAADGRRVEQVGVVFHRSAQPAVGSQFRQRPG
jgi:hypothetical protein